MQPLRMTERQTALQGKHDKPIETGSLRRFIGVLGPGLITGASDDDPSGIGTYSQAGAQLGFNIGWTMLLTYPLMVAIQEISARLGRTTGAWHRRQSLSALSELAAANHRDAAPRITMRDRILSLTGCAFTEDCRSRRACISSRRPLTLFRSSAFSA